MIRNKLSFFVKFSGMWISKEMAYEIYVYFINDLTLNENNYSVWEKNILTSDLVILVLHVI